MAMTKDQQTALWLGGWIPAERITWMLAQGYTNAQIAVATGTTVAAVARALALPTPT